MYSEMLAAGMVRGADAQREYLRTLRDQSLRLNHLVENVLAYARLERGRGLGPPTRTSLAQLIDPILPSLEQLAASEQMELVVEPTEAFEAPLWANPSAVEQILVNLVDNACKYAAGTTDRSICLRPFRPTGTLCSACVTMAQVCQPNETVSSLRKIGSGGRSLGPRDRARVSAQPPFGQANGRSSRSSTTRSPTEPPCSSTSPPRDRAVFKSLQGNNL